MTLSLTQLDAILKFDTCTIANAIEKFGVRLRNEGFTRPGLRCVTGRDSRLLGYAVTATVRSSDPPMTGNAYLDRTDWWTAIDGAPRPRVAVLRDLDPPESGGSVVGEVHSAILKAFDCLGVVTNGAVRDIPAVRRLGFPMFAPYVTVSHSYMHLVNYGEPVEILGMRVCVGDLLYADCHGALTIPMEIADAVPDVAARLQAKDRRIVQACLSPGFSTEKLLNTIRSEPQ